MSIQLTIGRWWCTSSVAPRIDRRPQAVANRLSTVKLPVKILIGLLERRYHIKFWYEKQYFLYFFWKKGFFLKILSKTRHNNMKWESDGWTQIIGLFEMNWGKCAFNYLRCLRVTVAWEGLLTFSLVCIWLFLVLSDSMFFSLLLKKNPPDGFWWNLMAKLQAPGRQRKHWGVEFWKFSDVAFSFLPTSSSVGEVKSKTSRESFPSFTLKRDSSILSFFLFILSVGLLDIQLFRVDSYFFYEE